MTGNQPADETPSEDEALIHAMENPSEGALESDSTADSVDTSVTFPMALEEMEVGDEAGLIDFEHRSGYGRIAIERTEDGESDIIKLQRADSNADNGYSDIETITTVGRWFSRHGAWMDLLPEDERNQIA